MPNWALAIVVLAVLAATQAIVHAVKLRKMLISLSTDKGGPMMPNISPEPLIPLSVIFAAARDVLLDRFSDVRVDGIKLRQTQAELISSEICDLAIRRLPPHSLWRNPIRQ